MLNIRAFHREMRLKIESVRNWIFTLPDTLVMANTRLTWTPIAGAMAQFEWIRIGSCARVAQYLEVVMRSCLRAATRESVYRA